MNLNKDMNIREIIYILLIFALVVASVLVIILRIIPLKKENMQLINDIAKLENQEFSNETEPMQLVDLNGYEINDYDLFMDKIYEISQNYNIDYMSVENENIDSGSSDYYLICSNVKLNSKDIAPIFLLKPFIEKGCNDFEIISDDIYEFSFKKYFIMDEYYGLKDYEVDNRVLNAEERNEDVIVGEYINNDLDSNNDYDSTKDILKTKITHDIEEKDKKILVEGIYNFYNKKVYLNPTIEELYMSKEQQLAPIINRESLIVSMVNKSDQSDGAGSIDIADIKPRFFTGDVDIVLHFYKYDKTKIDVALLLEDFYGNEFEINGNIEDNIAKFHLDTNYNFPVDIKGLSIKIPKLSSSSMALTDFDLEINDELNKQIKEGKNAFTVVNEKRQSVHNFLSSISRNIDVVQFLSDNVISEESFNNKKSFIIRLDQIYEIR